MAEVGGRGRAGRWRSAEVGGGRRGGAQWRSLAEVGGGRWRRSVEVGGGRRGWRSMEVVMRVRIICGVAVEVVLVQAFHYE